PKASRRPTATPITTATPTATATVAAVPTRTTTVAATATPKPSASASPSTTPTTSPPTPTLIHTARPPVTPTVARLAQVASAPPVAQPPSPAESLVRRYLEALAHVDDSTARAALGGGAASSDEIQYLDPSMHITAVSASHGASGATQIQVELRTAKGQ